ncbi:PilZ domain-containing protein [Pseudomonas typographi]|uniref:PilZ domain-containing protein n=1 Tax=Pseudomonas typographi TaxID=2715964 RepID=A0ABR7YXE9_9PSED|nr:PilZ domain-containing protein [Pseudomonas typographi]MBD1550932.1 PilZ domain-containing protein [Pseudomonas typographi]MBD1585757.1 PilZ domain-containing protein [Pseudomonas typographi]MBD1597831.1 PilZ domain-containing protein [Pseudomonas typographi]
MAKFIERRIERHQLPYYLKVYNRYTDLPIGYLGNVSEAGLMLISQLPLLVGPDFELQLRVPVRAPEADATAQLINLTASCLWCHEDATPGYYDSGFMLLQAPLEYEQLVQALRRYFSFLPMSASA